MTTVLQRMHVLEAALVSHLSRHEFTQSLNSDGPGSQYWDLDEVGPLSEDSNGDLHGAQIRLRDLHSDRTETYRLVLVPDGPPTHR